MILWTIMPEPALAALESKGELACDGRRICRWHRDAYRWMAARMAERIGPPPRPRLYPLWAWHTWESADRRRPDLRATAHLPKGTRGCRIEFEIADGEALLSDFDAWHAVLNGWHLSRNEEEDDAFDAERTAAGVRYGWPYPEPFRSRIIASWDRVFEFGPPTPTWCHGENPSVQATFWTLRADAVRRVDRFTAR